MLAGKKSTLVSKSLLGVAYLMLVSGVILGLCQIFIIPRMFHKEIEKVGCMLFHMLYVEHILMW